MSTHSYWFVGVEIKPKFHFNYLLSVIIWGRVKVHFKYLKWVLLEGQIVDNCMGNDYDHCISVSLVARAVLKLRHSGFKFHPPLTLPIEHSLAYILRNVCLLLGRLSAQN